MWKEQSNQDWTDIYGFELTYSSDCCGYADIVHMYGSRTGTNVWSVSITQKVTAVKFMYSDSSGGLFNYKLRDIWFTLADGSFAKTCNCLLLCNSEKTITLSVTQSLVGLATKSFGINLNDQLNADGDLSIWTDNVA
jgi:hypothetical protein